MSASLCKIDLMTATFGVRSTLASYQSKNRLQSLFKILKISCLVNLCMIIWMFTCPKGFQVQMVTCQRNSTRCRNQKSHINLKFMFSMQPFRPVTLRICYDFGHVTLGPKTIHGPQIVHNFPNPASRIKPFYMQTMICSKFILLPNLNSKIKTSNRRKTSNPQYIMFIC